MGIFRKLKSIIINNEQIERPIRINNVFVLITNLKGKITEISENCDKILGLS